MVDREGVWESAICYAGWISAAEENCLHRSSLYHFQSCSLAACGSACPGKLWPLQAASVVPLLSYFRLLPRLASLCINDRIKLHPTVLISLLFLSRFSAFLISSCFFIRVFFSVSFIGLLLVLLLAIVLACHLHTSSKSAGSTDFYIQSLFRLTNQIAG